MAKKLSEVLKGLPEGPLVPYQFYKACLNGLEWLAELREFREQMEALMTE